MTDYFALLGLPRRPWLEIDIVKDHFHRRAAAHHPDAANGNATAFAELNAGYVTLRDPGTRVRHFLNLVSPEIIVSSTSAPAELGDLFLRIGSLTHRLNGFFIRESQATTPISRALLTSERRALREELHRLIRALEEQEQRSLQSLRSLDVQWNERREDVAERLAAVGVVLSFLSKWSAQLRGHAVELSASNGC